MKIIGTIIAIATGMLGYNINAHHLNSWCPLFWSIVDFFFAPFAWAKWLIMGQINMSIIHDTFSFFLK